MRLAEIVLHFAWYMNVFAIVLILATRFLSHTRGTWAFVGVILLASALGNAVLTSIALLPADVRANLLLSIPLQATALFGLVVFGSLGSRFVGEWLTAGART